MVDILNLALPYFGLIFVGFACGKAKSLPESGLAWMNFFLLYVSLPALLFAIMSKTPFSELNNPPFLVATTLSTVAAFTIALVVGKVFGRLTLREATLAGLSGGYGNIGYMGPGLALAVLGPKASAPTALIFCCDSIFLFSIVPLLIELSDRAVRAWCDGGVAAVRSSPVGGAGRDRGQTPDPSAHVVCADAGVRPVRAALGCDRGADGLAAAGTERVRHRPAERCLDRIRLRRRAARDFCVRGDADQRDVAAPDRPAGVSVKRYFRQITAARLASGLRASQNAAAGRWRRAGACRPHGPAGAAGSR